VKFPEPATLQCRMIRFTYKQTLKDFENADEFLVPGGFILFDDSEVGGSFGSTAAAKLAASKGNYRLVGRNPNYTHTEERSGLAVQAKAQRKDATGSSSVACRRLP
jgi:hypothetical protein